MKNQYFLWDDWDGWEQEPISDNEYSGILKQLRADRDFVPGNPLVLEFYHVSWYDFGSGKYSHKPESCRFFNVPRVNKHGVITSTSTWSHQKREEFLEYLENTEYFKFSREHWAQKDYTPKFRSDNDIQAVRVLYQNHFIQEKAKQINDSVQELCFQSCPEYLLVR